MNTRNRRNMVANLNVERYANYINNSNQKIEILKTLRTALLLLNEINNEPTVVYTTSANLGPTRVASI